MDDLLAIFWLFLQIQSAAEKRAIIKQQTLYLGMFYNRPFLCRTL
jgi:hypothetical protein